MIYITQPSVTPPTAPFDDADACQAWGRSKLPHALAAFRQATTTGDAPSAALLDTVCDVLRVSVGCLAKMHNNNGAAELSMRSELICDCTPKDDNNITIAFHLAEGLVTILQYTLEFVPDCHLDDKTRQTFIDVLMRAIGRCLDTDPDLLRPLFEALCDKLLDAFDRAHPTDAITTIDELQAFLHVVDGELPLAWPPADGYARAATCEDTPITSPEVREERDPNTQIAHLEARLREIEGYKRWDMGRRDWLGRRLATLRN